MRGPTVANPVVERSCSTTAVVTPQAVLLEFRPAGIGSRVLAKLIDVAIQLLLLIVLAFVAAALSGSAVLIVTVVWIFAVVFVYPATEAFMNGQTIGKKALSIRVITADGGPVRFRHAAIRSLVGFIELFLLPPGGPMALITALLTQRSQRVGDLVAETLVVRDKTDLTYPVFFNPPLGAEHIALNLDTTRLTHPQYGVLRQFVLRSSEMEPAPRIDLAHNLCAKLQLLGIVPPANIDPSLFVAAVVFAHQRRFATGLGAAPAMAPPPPSQRIGAPLSGSAPGPVGRAVPLPPPAPRR